MTPKENQIIQEDNKEEFEHQTQVILLKDLECNKLIQKYKKIIRETAECFVNIMELHNLSLGDHSKRVSSDSVEVAKLYKLDEREIELIEIAAKLHDIGMIEVPKDLLNKPFSEMKDEEKELIEKHPVSGQTIISAIEEFHNIGVLIRSHHERYDGKGFPDGLNGEEIPLGSRIIFVADAYDAMVNKRNPLMRFTHEEAILHLKKFASIRFDPEVIIRFLATVKKSSRVLSPGEMAISVSQLRENMILSEGIYSRNGILIAQKGEKLSALRIEKIKNLHEIDPIIDDIIVKK